MLLTSHATVQKSFNLNNGGSDVNMTDVSEHKHHQQYMRGVIMLVLSSSK